MNSSSKLDEFVVTRTEFVVAMVVLNRVLAVTKQLSVRLQEVNKDLTKCLLEVELQVNLLQRMHADTSASFTEMTHEAETCMMNLCSFHESVADNTIVTVV